MYLQKKIISVLTILTLSLIISGCQNASEPTPEASGEPIQEETNDSAVSQAAEEIVDTKYPLTITHALGQTVIESKPERIATISWGNQDTPLALGIVPVGVSTANYGVLDGSGLLPWTKEAFSDLDVSNPNLFDDVAGLDFEAISDATPDVILAAYSGITQEEYDLLSEIAPVVAYPSAPWQTFWRDQILYDSMGMGMEEEGIALVKDLEALIEEKTSNYPELDGVKAAFFYFNPTDLGKFYVYLPSDPRAAYLLDLGMAFPESVNALANDSSSFAIELSAENVDRLNDIDLIITYGTDGLLETLQNDPLISTLPAVQKGSVAIIEDATPLAASGTPSALSIPATIDEYLEILAEAVNAE